tara:strand:+ start:2244 stop:3095 length:852 start_codon:yes stop_codon:yes gene_type:complete
MSEIQNIKKLRQFTGAGFKDCNNALKESEGDINKAIEILRVKGIAKASKKMTREAKEGVIAISGDHTSTSLLEVNCETDFVAKNDAFIDFVREISEINHKCEANIEKLQSSVMKNNLNVKENLLALISKIGEKITIGRAKTLKNSKGKNFYYQHTLIKENLSKLAVIVSLEVDQESDQIDIFGKQLSMHIAASSPLALTSDLIDQDVLRKEQTLIAEELKNSGKSDEIAKKISLGKLNKFKDENSLLSQNWVMEPKKKVKEIINELKINNLKIKEFIRIKIGE